MQSGEIQFQISSTFLKKVKKNFCLERLERVHPSRQKFFHRFMGRVGVQVGHNYLLVAACTMRAVSSLVAAAMGREPSVIPRATT